MGVNQYAEQVWIETHHQQVFALPIAKLDKAGSEREFKVNRQESFKEDQNRLYVYDE